MENLQNVAIPVCFSFEAPISEVFKHPPYMPVKCGGFQTDAIEHSDDGFEDSLSMYNKYLNEMTMIWWMVKNPQIFEKYDYIGTAQYRRHLVFKPEDLKPSSIICYRKVNALMGNASTFSVFHDINTFNAYYHDLADQMDNDFKKKFCIFLMQNIHYDANIFIMSKDIFQKYASFIEPCIQIAAQHVKNEAKTLDQLPTYDSRIYAFILERMTSFFIFDQSMNGVQIINRPWIKLDISSPYQRDKKSLDGIKGKLQKVNLMLQQKIQTAKAAKA